MKEFSCDILIVGSGLIGLVCAYSLSLLGYKIVITEQKKLEKKDNSFFDTRTTAISQGSKQFLDKETNKNLTPEQINYIKKQISLLESINLHQDFKNINDCQFQCHPNPNPMCLMWRI